MLKNYIMPLCVLTGKKTIFGLKRSHSLRSTKRRWKPNMQKLTNGNISIKVTAKALKSVKLNSNVYL